MNTSSQQQQHLQRLKSNLRTRQTSLTIEVPTAVELELQPTKGSKTFLQQQPYLLAYAGAISLISPAATAYQLCKLYKLQRPSSQLLRMSMSIFPHQTALKVIQMNSSTPIKEYCNPWMAFAAMGVLQGGVYGQCNMYFSKALQLGTTTASIAGIFRGSGFAGVRDCMSQGVPFMFSDRVRSQVLDKAWDTTEEDNAIATSVKHWTSVLGTSIVATYMSQGVHNFQIAMQADQTLTYRGAVESVMKQHGVKGLIRGAEARVGLLLVVNVLNELLLKKAWS
jgi:hypothetical protein